jgi:spore coat polysaccharide biosynthesis predicted glycosyltransferase SpsG
MGHVYQSLTLARFLNETANGNDVFFITKSDERVASMIGDKGYKVLSFTDDDQILATLENEKPDRIVFDKLDVAPELAQKIKTGLNIRLIICTNLTSANDWADVTVLADIGSNFENLYKRDPLTGKVAFFGPKYWILRPEFYRYKKAKKQKSQMISKVMLIFGGSDPCNISSAALNELLKMDSSFSITLVLGPAFEHNDDLTDVLEANKESKSTVQIVRNIANVAEVMYESDLVLASPGLSFFEALAVGTPVIGFHQDEVQKEAYEGYLPTMDVNEAALLPEIIRKRAFIFPEDAFVAKMEIGDGKDQIINEILNQ